MSDVRLPKILVVDDDLGVIAAYRRVLEGGVDAAAAARMKQFAAIEQELFADTAESAETDRNWRVTFADQGKDASALVREAIEGDDPFDVVFLDLQMPPGIDGCETARQIRELNSRAHIVFVSAFSEHIEDDLVAIAGPEHRVSFLPKPVWPDELLAAAVLLTARSEKPQAA